MNIIQEKLNIRGKLDASLKIIEEMMTTAGRMPDASEQIKERIDAAGIWEMQEDRIESVLVEIGLEEIAMERIEKSVDVNSVIDLSLYLEKRGNLEKVVPATMLEVIVEGQTINQVEKTFGYIMKINYFRDDEVKKTNRGKGMVMLRTINSVMKRIPESTGRGFRGKMMEYSSEIFEICERSGVNLKGDVYKGESIVTVDLEREEEEYVRILVAGKMDRERRESSVKESETLVDEDKEREEESEFKAMKRILERIEEARRAKRDKQRSEHVGEGKSDKYIGESIEKILEQENNQNKMIIQMLIKLKEHEEGGDKRKDQAKEAKAKCLRLLRDTDMEKMILYVLKGENNWRRWKNNEQAKDFVVRLNEQEIEKKQERKRKQREFEEENGDIEYKKNKMEIQEEYIDALATNIEDDIATKPKVYLKKLREENDNEFYRWKAMRTTLFTNAAKLMRVKATTTDLQELCSDDEPSHKDV